MSTTFFFAVVLALVVFFAVVAFLAEVADLETVLKSGSPHKSCIFSTASTDITKFLGLINA